MTKYLIFFIIISACGKNSSTLTIKEDTPQPDIQELICNDFNSLNHGQKSICDCPIGYTTALDGLSCIDMQVVAKINIETENRATILKDDYTNGFITINANELHPSWSDELPMKIKGRGNSTWEFPKKPYKIKLSTSKSIMGMPADKEWVLLANYSDKTLMRVIIANEMGRRLGMDYTPRFRTVELTVNGDFRGTYLLTEQIKISPSRVNAIKEDISGGYLLELDHRLDNEFVVTTNSGIPFAVKEPEEPSEEELLYLNNYLNQFEEALYSAGFTSSEGYKKYIDERSFINWYIVNEVLKNVDAANYSSIYLFKSSNQKLKIGPLWDFDISAGNLNYSEAQEEEGWWIRVESEYYRRLFEDEAFELKVKQRWAELKLIGLDLPELLKLVDQKSYALQLTQQKNFDVWEILDIYVWPNRLITGTYVGETALLKDWLTKRLRWLNQQYQNDSI